jgi:hypothetical protein
VAIVNFFVAITLFDEECLGFLDQRKQAKSQWVQDLTRQEIYVEHNTEALLQWKNNKYYISRGCVCRHRYTVCKAYVPCTMLFHIIP